MARFLWRADMNRVLPRLMCCLIVLTLLPLSACGPDYLKDDNYKVDDADFRIDGEAQIQDTKEHREILEMLASYRIAVVKKDFGALNRMVSTSYYDNATTTNTTKDDYGHPQLKSVFELMAAHTDSIQYRMTVKQMEVAPMEAHVDYEYRYTYQYTVGDEVSWDAGVEVNRLDLRKIQGEWKIISGL